MTPTAFMLEVHRELTVSGVQATLNEHTITIDSPFEIVEIIYAPERCTGTQGGTIDIGYEDSDEIEESHRFLEATPSQIAQSALKY